MSSQIIFHSDIQVIETAYSGVMAREELFSVAYETLSVAEQNNCNRFLADCSTLDGGHTIFDLYFLAREVTARAGLKIMYEAVLMPSYPSLMDKINFWETVGVNRGFKVCIFRERAAALEWLAGTFPPKK
jgi:hypothetical protein